MRGRQSVRVSEPLAPTCSGVNFGAVSFLSWSRFVCGLGMGIARILGPLKTTALAGAAVRKLAAVASGRKVRTLPA